VHDVPLADLGAQLGAEGFQCRLFGGVGVLGSLFLLGLLGLVGLGAEVEVDPGVGAAVTVTTEVEVDVDVGVTGEAVAAEVDLEVLLLLTGLLLVCGRGAFSDSSPSGSEFVGKFSDTSLSPSLIPWFSRSYSVIR
jgi:hypothetical protein